MSKIYCSNQKNLPKSVQKLFDRVRREQDQDKDGVIRRRAPVSQVKAVSEVKEESDILEVQGYMNFSLADRMSERIPPSAWEKYMKRYLANPIILRQHNHNHPIGRATDVKIKKDGLWYKGEIGDPSKAQLTDMQRETRSLVLQGILVANSVGFIPHVLQWDEDAEELSYVECELLENSIVSVPCQQDSLLSSGKSYFDMKSNSGKGSGMGLIANAVKGQSELIQKMNDSLAALNVSVSTEVKGLKDENADLKAKLAKAESDLAVAKEAQAKAESEKAALEKEANDLIENLQKQGLFTAEEPAA